MEDFAEQAVRRVVKMMHENLGEDLTIDDMARVAMFSKFHFSRMFQRVTGLSPGRFLSALRLQEAKRLLVSSSLSVTEISHRIGYTSVGTFSSRFSRCVGISPTMYRHMGGVTKRIQIDETLNLQAAPKVDLRGRVAGPPDHQLGLIFIGLFPNPVPQGRPVRCSILAGPGSFELENVPVGVWHLLVHSVGAVHDESLDDVGGDGLFVGVHGPLEIAAGVTVSPVDIQLRPMQILDPPVLLALMDVRSVAMAAEVG